MTIKGVISGTTISQRQVGKLSELLASSGFIPPDDDWLLVRLQDIVFRYEELAERLDPKLVAERTSRFAEYREAIITTDRLLDVWADGMTSPRLNPEVVTNQGVWDEMPVRHLNSDEELASALMPPEFSQADIDVAKRVHAHLAELFDSVHRSYLEGRRVTNEHRERIATVQGFVRLWCQAMKIPQSDIRISASTGSPAMNS
ncbi:hypothetical protein NKK52_12340 [Mesorhizobium sp. C277A]|uniref:hypothetical protein n=1 Tax=Mesorhizobium sp. C277A TaxID=2956827 RepID=UPI0003CF76AF|nr:hypothetical protein [Mesorhizobium sp. LSJC277A00]ESW72007.1 hypothetical protein X771_04250 [Mesorhizobium sp. LSJC277A00]